MKRYETAMRAWREGRYAEALAAGKALEAEQFSGAFEVQALAHQGLGDPEAALAALRRGVALTPQVWVLWKLVGDCESDAGRFEEALRGYDRAAACPGAEVALVEINRAIAQSRAGRPDEALATLDRVSDPAWHAAREQVALDTLARAARWEAVLARVAKREAAAGAEGLDDAARGHRARALFELGSRDEARAVAEALTGSGAFDEQAAWTLRALEARRSPSARRWALRVEAKLPKPARRVAGELYPEGFLRNFEVVADDEAEALRLIAWFHREGERASLRVAEATPRESASEELVGVYGAGGYFWYGKQ